jgi:hypothetical protein
MATAVRWAILGTCLVLTGCGSVLSTATHAEQIPAAVAMDPGRVCGTIHSWVPYSTRAGGSIWRVYAIGDMTCPAAEASLYGVMHDRGTVNFSRGYVAYRGWRCNLGKMGIQHCWPRSGMWSQHAEGFANRCSEVVCPTDRAPAY